MSEFVQAQSYKVRNCDMQACGRVLEMQAC